MANDDQNATPSDPGSSKGPGLGSGPTTSRPRSSTDRLDDLHVGPRRPPSSARQPKILVGAGVTAIVVVVIAALVIVWPRSDGAATAARDFARNWTDGHLAQSRYEGRSGDDVAKDYTTIAAGLASGPVQVDVDSMAGHTAKLHVTWKLGGQTWAYASQAEMTKSDGAWAVRWNPAIVNPQLQPGDHLSLERVQPRRGEILAGDGHALVTGRPTVEVGVEPRRVPNVDTLATQLSQLLNLDGPMLAKQIRAAKPDAFVSVLTLRRDDYDTIKHELQPLPGTTFREATLPLAPTRQFASALLGRVGPVTSEIVDKSDGRYQAGDNAGLSGLQQQYDERLRGKPGVRVTLVKADDTADNTSTTLFAVDAQDGQSLRTTLDESAQTAAEAAITGQSKPTSFVAMKASTGEVLAVANGPEVGGNDRALVGQYPPGSSFKTVSTYALLQKGLRPDEEVACPPTINVSGKSFKNAENEAFGSAPFHVDFAKSCNTAFVKLSSRLDKSTLSDTAPLFGLGTKWDLGVPSFSGSVPKNTDDIDLAAAAFGQGRTLVSPLAMANVAATVAKGNWQQPSLITDPAPAPAPSGQPLDASTTATLRSLMREVVTDGTGSALANVPGQPVYGKTGTAEYGTQVPPPSHAWFIGYQGDVAFAAFVEGGEFGGDTAAPIAAKFLTTLASR